MNLSANAAKVLVAIMNEYSVAPTVMAAIRGVILDDVDKQLIDKEDWKTRAEHAEAAINLALSSTNALEPYFVNVLSKGLR